MFIFCDDRDVRKLEDELRFLTDKALPFATLDTLNRTVVGAQARIRQALPKKMTMRNRWTAGSIGHNKARGLVIERQAAEIGSAQEYMAEQEEGFTRVSRGRHGVPVPTAFSAGQGTSRKRTKIVRKAMRMANIKIKKFRGLGVNDKQRTVRTVQEAVKSGKRYVFLQFRVKKGIYRVVGGKKNVKRGWPEGAHLRLVWSLTHRVIVTGKTQWLEPETDRAQAQMTEIYRRALNKQLARLHI